MPQQNECIKCKFATLFNQLHVMLNGGKFTTYLPCSLQAKAVNTAMILKNHQVTPNRILSPFQQFFRKGKKFVFPFGEKIWWNVHHHVQEQFP